jgi:hypothetical protein
MTKRIVIVEVGPAYGVGEGDAEAAADAVGPPDGVGV